jgi:FG-GAP repeat
MAGVAGHLSGLSGRARSQSRTGGLSRRCRLGGVVMLAGLLAAGLTAGPASAVAGARLPASARGFLAAVGLAHSPNDLFGFSVAISGNVAAVGAPGVQVSRGAVYVYQRSHGRWRQAATLLGPVSTSSPSFGNGVAVSGSTLLVGAPNLNGGNGATYIYRHSRGRWRLSTTLADPGPGGDDFGYAVAVSGSWATIGAPAYSAAAAAGTVYIYSMNGGSPRLRATIADPAGAAGDWFGVSVAVSSSRAGVFAVAGTFQDEIDILTESGGGWHGKAVTGPRYDFGLTVGVSGKTVVVGADARTPDGLAYVYARSGGTWRRRARLSVPHPPAGHDFEFGAGVAISGNRILIGSPITNGRGCDRGYEFRQARSGRWRERTVIKAPVCRGTFSYAMAISGTTAIIGASGEHNRAGAAYYLTLS